jgi:hypothetical protein
LHIKLKRLPHLPEGKKEEKEQEVELGYGEVKDQNGS